MDEGCGDKRIIGVKYIHTSRKWSFCQCLFYFSDKRKSKEIEQQPLALSSFVIYSRTDEDSICSPIFCAAFQKRPHLRLN